MNRDTIDEILRRTMEDGKLSGSEKRLLEAGLAEFLADEEELAFFRHRAFALARAALVDGQAPKTLDWLEAVIKVLLPRSTVATGPTISEAYFSQVDDCPRKIVQLLSQAAQSLKICVFTITDDRIAAALEAAHHRGVAVRVLTDNDKALDLGSDVMRLQQAGVAVRVDRTPFHMHHKFAVIDGALLLNGSYNWTRGAARDNHENFLVTSDPTLISQFSRRFDQLWESLG